MLIALRVLDKTSYLSLFDLTYQARMEVRMHAWTKIIAMFPLGIPCVESPVYVRDENYDFVDICPYVR